jgi:hypothetical protein
LYLTQQLETYKYVGFRGTSLSPVSVDEVGAEGINEIGAPGPECDEQAVTSGVSDAIASVESEIRNGVICSPLIWAPAQTQRPKDRSWPA